MATAQAAKARAGEAPPPHDMADVPEWFTLGVGWTERLPGAPAFVTLEWIDRWASATNTGLRKLHDGIRKRRHATGKFGWWPARKPEPDDLPYLIAMAMSEPRDFPTVLRDYSLGNGRGSIRRSTFFDRLYDAYYEGPASGKSELAADIAFVDFLEDPETSVSRLGILLDRIRKAAPDQAFATREPYASLFQWVGAHFPEVNPALADASAGPKAEPAKEAAEEAAEEAAPAAEPQKPAQKASPKAVAPAPKPAAKAVAAAAKAAPAPSPAADDLPATKAAPAPAQAPAAAPSPSAESTVAPAPARTEPALAVEVPPKPAQAPAMSAPAAPAAASVDDDEAMRDATERCRAALGDAVRAIEAALAQDAIPRAAIRPAAAAVLEAARQARRREALASAPADVAELLAGLAGSLAMVEGLGMQALSKVLEGLRVGQERTLVPRESVRDLRAEVEAVEAAAKGIAESVAEAKEVTERMARTFDFALADDIARLRGEIGGLGERFAASLGQVRERIETLRVPEPSPKAAPKPAAVHEPEPASRPRPMEPARAPMPVHEPAAPQREQDAMERLQEAMRRAPAAGERRRGVALADLQATQRGAPGLRQLTTDHVSSAVLNLVPAGTEGFDRTVATCVRWMIGKGAVGIPAGAVSGDDFRTDAAGAIYARGLSIDNGGSRIWAGVYQDFDEREAGRKWAVEMCLGEMGGTLKFGVRLMTSSKSGHWNRQRTMPRVVRDVMRSLSAYDGPHLMQATARRLSGAEGVEEFEALAFSRGRQLPVVALSCDTRTGEPVASADSLATSLAGAAHVVVLEDSVTRVVSAKHGKHWSVYLGAVRIYQPGADPVSGDPEDHRYHKAEGILRMNASRQGAGAGLFELSVVDTILRDTEKRFTGSSIPTFESVEAIAAQIARRDAEDRAKAAGALDEGLVATYKAEIDSQRRVIDETNSLFETASEELKQAEVDRDDAWSRNVALMAEVSRLRAALSGRASDQERVPAAPKPPETLEELCEFAETGLGLEVTVLPKAVRETRKTRNVDVRRLYEGLTFLRDVYVPYRRGAIEQKDYMTALRKARFNEDACFASRGSINAFPGYTALWRGERIELDRHLKWGVGGTDTMLRIYFHYDEESQSCIIGHMPTHLDNHLTN